MRFLVDASLPRSAARALRTLGHEATDVRDIGLRDAHDDVIAAHAHRDQLALVTRDFDFADIRNYPPTEYAGIVVLDLPNDATAPQVLMAVTSQLLRPAGAVGEVLITEWQKAGLPKASLIKPVLTTIEKRLILRKLGELQEPDRTALGHSLAAILG